VADADRPIRATRCPLCGGDNACAPATDGTFERRCWCEDASFDRALLDRIPAAAGGRACVCRSCAAAHSPDAAID
jgi:hypothetical protein